MKLKKRLFKANYPVSFIVPNYIETQHIMATEIPNDYSEVINTYKRIWLLCM